MNLSHKAAYLWALFSIFLVAGAVVAMGILLDRQTDALKQQNQELLCLGLVNDPSVKPVTIRNLCGDLVPKGSR